MIQAIKDEWDVTHDPEAAAPEWAELSMATIDLPDAYRHCPVLPAHQGASVIAAWSERDNAWRYMQLHGLAFGLTSAVVSFNRFPTLLAAAVRRIHATFTSAYFDDVPVVDVSAGGTSGVDAMMSTLVQAGAPPTATRCSLWANTVCSWASRAR